VSRAPEPTNAVAGRVVRRLRVLEAELDAAIGEATGSLPISCRRGCAHCCHMPVIASLPEAAALVEHLLGKPGGEARLVAALPELRRQTELLFDRATTTAAYFARQIPCVFLDGEGACGVYAARPAACRVHLVTSEPAACSAASSAPIDKLDLAAHHDGFWAAAMIEARAQDIPFLYAPLPLAVTVVLTFVQQGPAALEALLEGTPFGQGVKEDQALWGHLVAG
jgi:Fe-S-cluster containining protein